MLTSDNHIIPSLTLYNDCYFFQATHPSNPTTITLISFNRLTYGPINTSACNEVKRHSIYHWHNIKTRMSPYHFCQIVSPQWSPDVSTIAHNMLLGFSIAIACKSIHSSSLRWICSFLPTETFCVTPGWTARFNNQCICMLRNFCNSMFSEKKKRIQKHQCYSSNLLFLVLDTHISCLLIIKKGNALHYVCHV